MKLSGIIAAIAIAMFSGGAVASDIFTWTDTNGVIHFSQWAPDDVTEVSKLVVHADNPPGYDPLEDPYSIRNQAERTNETWKELEARKKKRRDNLREERERMARSSAPSYEQYYYARPRTYWPIYRPINRPVRPPIHLPVHPPGHGPTPLPIHPVARPVFSPDPMRSAHIGVRRNPAPNAPPQIQ